MTLFRSRKLSDGSRAVTRTIGLIGKRYMLSTSWGDELWFNTLGNGTRSTFFFGLQRYNHPGATSYTLVLLWLTFTLGWRNK